MLSFKAKMAAPIAKAEQSLGIDLAYATKGGLWATIGFAGGVIASLVSVIAFGNLLSKESYGTYNYLLSLAGSLSFLTLSGTATAIIRAVALHKEEVVPYSLKLQLRYNLLAVGTIGAAAVYYYANGNGTFALCLALLAGSLPIAQAYHSYEQILSGRKNFELSAKIASLSAIASTAATIVALTFTQSVIILVSIYAALSLVSNWLAYQLVALKNLDEPRVEDLTELRRTAFHMTATGLIGNLAQYIDKIILFQIAGPVTLAVYTFATAGPERLKGLIKNLVSISLPKLTSRTIGEIRSTFYKRLLIAALIGLSLFLFYVIASPLLFRLFLPKYLDSIKYSQVYSSVLIFIPVTIYIGNIFLSQNMIRASYLSSAGIQALRIGLIVILGILFKTWGLIIASPVLQAASAAYAVIIWELESRRIAAKMDKDD